MSDKDSIKAKQIQTIIQEKIESWQISQENAITILDTIERKYTTIQTQKAQRTVSMIRVIKFMLNDLQTTYIEKYFIPSQMKYIYHNGFLVVTTSWEWWFDEKGSCNMYWFSNCINFIFKDTTLIYKNINIQLTPWKEWQRKTWIQTLWEVSTITNSGIVFSYELGEWYYVCGRWMEQRQAYYNFDDNNRLYGKEQRWPDCSAISEEEDNRLLWLIEWSEEKDQDKYDAILEKITTKTDHTFQLNKSDAIPLLTFDTKQNIEDIYYSLHSKE